MRWWVFAAFVVVLAGGFVSGMVEHGTFTVTRPTVPPVTTVGFSHRVYNTLCGYELFFWKVYGDTVFRDNYFVLRRYFACRPVRVRKTAPVDSMLVSYYLWIFSATGDVESYLVMRDYPVVYRVDRSVPSPLFNPIIYARFEGGVGGETGGGSLPVDLCFTRGVR